MQNDVIQDLNPAFKAHPVTGDILKTKGVNAIAASVANILKTEPYERVMRPGLGTPLRDILFEPMDGITATAIKTIIGDSILLYEPRAKVVRINVEPRPVDEQYFVEIVFTVDIQTEPVFLETYLTRER